MKIKREFAKLKAFAATDNGWKTIEHAFTKTNELLSFAIDPTSWKYKIGRPGERHAQAKADLLHRLLHETTYQEYERAERCIAEGWLARLEGYQRHLILLKHADISYLEWIEPHILQMKIGLPVGIIFHRRKINAEPNLSNVGW